VEEPEHSHGIEQLERNCPTGDDANERKALTGEARHRYKILVGDTSRKVTNRKTKEREQKMKYVF
jgi:hypothetical protein